MHLRPHGSAPPTAARPRAYAGGGPWWRISAFGLPMAGRQAAADDARPRPPEPAPEHALKHAACPSDRRSPAPRARSSRPSAATQCAPSPPPPRARGRVVPRCSPGTSPPPGGRVAPRCSPGTSPPPGRPRAGSGVPGPQRREHWADEVALYLLAYARVGCAVRLPAECARGRASARALAT